MAVRSRGQAQNGRSWLDAESTHAFEYIYRCSLLLLCLARGRRMLAHLHLDLGSQPAENHQHARPLGGEEKAALVEDGEENVEELKRREEAWIQARSKERTLRVVVTVMFTTEPKLEMLMKMNICPAAPQRQ